MRQGGEDGRGTGEVYMDMGMGMGRRRGRTPFDLDPIGHLLASTSSSSPSPAHLSLSPISSYSYSFPRPARNTPSRRPDRLRHTKSLLCPTNFLPPCMATPPMYVHSSMPLCDRSHYRVLRSLGARCSITHERTCNLRIAGHHSAILDARHVCPDVLRGIHLPCKHKVH